MKKYIIPFVVVIFMFLLMTMTYQQPKVFADSEDTTDIVYDFNVETLVQSTFNVGTFTINNADFYANKWKKAKSEIGVKIGGATGSTGYDIEEKYYSVLSYDYNLETCSSGVIECMKEFSGIKTISFEKSTSTLTGWAILVTSDHTTYNEVATGSASTSITYTFASPYSGYVALVVYRKSTSNPQLYLTSMTVSVIETENFAKLNTVSSMAITYDSETNDVSESKLRFGVIMPMTDFDEDASYGVLYALKSRVNSISSKYNNETSVEAFKNNNSTYKILYANCDSTIAKVDSLGNANAEGEYYRFSVVLSGLEGHYDSEFVAVCYKEVDDKVIFGKQTSFSVYSLANYYIEENVITNTHPVYSVIKGIYSFEISYVLDGGTNSANNETKFIYDHDIISLEDATKEGYDFLGWYTDSEFEHKITEIPASTRTNITLYAKFELSADPFNVYFLELGNEYAGDCTYIKAGDVDILIDAGSRVGSDTTIKNFINQYVTDGKLEYVIATHAHQDHIAAMYGTSSKGVYNGILYSYDVDTIIDYGLKNSTSATSTNYQTAVDYCVAKGTTHYKANQLFGEDKLHSATFNIAKNITMEVLYQKFYDTTSTDENNYSVCVMFNVNGNYFLFTGDLEYDGEVSLVANNPTLPKVQLFKGGHHGSKTSSNDCLLSLIQPEICGVCCCSGSSEYTGITDNQFPTQAFINRIAKYTDKVYCTTIATYTVKVAEKDAEVPGIKKDEEYLKTTGFTSMNGNIHVSFINNVLDVHGSNNDTKLKDTEWFNTYVTLNGVNRPMRTWPDYS